MNDEYPRGVLWRDDEYPRGVLWRDSYPPPSPPTTSILSTINMIGDYYANSDYVVIQNFTINGSLMYSSYALEKYDPPHPGFGSCVWATHTYNKRANHSLTCELKFL